MRASNNYVLVYNAGGTEILHVKPLRHAIRMLHRGVAIIREVAAGESFGYYDRPTAIELVQYVFQRWVLYPTNKDGIATYSRAGVLRRDNYRCAYCSRAANTIDHVKPQCQGGGSTWENVVASCGPCNSDKGGRTPEQAGMRLDWLPWAPTWSELFSPRKLTSLPA